MKLLTLANKPEDFSNRKVKFEEMGLYTLANLYIDATRPIHNTNDLYPEGAVLASDILLYVTFIRKDGEMFREIVKKTKELRGEKDNFYNCP